MICWEGLLEWWMRIVKVKGLSAFDSAAKNMCTFTLTFDVMMGWEWKCQSHDLIIVTVIHITMLDVVAGVHPSPGVRVRIRINITHINTTHHLVQAAGTVLHACDRWSTHSGDITALGNSTESRVNPRAAACRNHIILHACEDFSFSSPDTWYNDFILC